MPSLKYRVSHIKVIGSAAFVEASREELRVLLALIELSGQVDCVDALAELAEISSARCRAALAFWEESGVISVDDGEPIIIDEFEHRLVRGEIDVVPAVEVAESIRDEDLADMMEYCARLMGRACLSNEEIKNLTALKTQYGLSPVYVIMLADHMSHGGHLTVRLLCDRAIGLTQRNIDSEEALTAYLAEIENTTATEWELRRMLGIYNRALSDSERAYFKKWCEEYGYSVSIVALAYDIAVLNTQSGDLRYMDKLLTSWHESGCKTLSECRARVEEDRAKRNAEKSAGKKKAAKSAPDTPRYGNFDINEAFNNAVARSFVEEDDEGGDK